MDQKDLDIYPWLYKFHSLSKQSPGDIPLSVSIGDPNASTHFVLGAAIHGNEYSAIPVFVRVIEKLRNYPLRSKLTFFIGNEAAILNNRRFIKYDMNRLFVKSEATSKEHLRAQEIMHLLDTADFYVDFHQTIQPTQKPFYIFMQQQESVNFARLLEGSKICVIEPAMLGTQKSSEQYVQQQGRVGVTIEVGQIGQHQECYAIINQVVNKVCALASRYEELPKEYLALMAEAKSPLETLEINHQIKFHTSGDQLKRGWRNLDFVREGSLLGVRANGEVLLAPFDSYMFFPKYPARDEVGCVIGSLPTNLCELAVASDHSMAKTTAISLIL